MRYFHICSPDDELLSVPVHFKALSSLSLNICWIIPNSMPVSWRLIWLYWVSCYIFQLGKLLFNEWRVWAWIQVLLLENFSYKTESRTETQSILCSYLRTYICAEFWWIDLKREIECGIAGNPVGLGSADQSEKRKSINVQWLFLPFSHNFSVSTLLE